MENKKTCYAFDYNLDICLLFGVSCDLKDTYECYHKDKKEYYSKFANSSSCILKAYKKES